MSKFLKVIIESLLHEFVTDSEHYHFIFRSKKLEQAYIKVGPTKQYYQEGKCLLYDTTYEHETFNTSPDEDRIVLHVDFYNSLKMTKLEIDIMQYIYSMREKYLQAEGGDNNLL